MRTHFAAFFSNHVYIGLFRSHLYSKNVKPAIFRFTSSSSYVNANPNRIDTKHQKAENMKGKKSIIYICTYTHTQPINTNNNNNNNTISGGSSKTAKFIPLYMGTFVVFVSQSLSIYCVYVLSSLVRMRMKSGKCWMWQSSSNSKQAKSW